MFLKKNFKLKLIINKGCNMKRIIEEALEDQSLDVR